MKEVDARGLSCPEPLMLTAEALKSADGPVKVLVTEPHQKTNVEKYAKDHGKKTTSAEKDGYIEKKRIETGHNISYDCGCYGYGKGLQGTKCSRADHPCAKSDFSGLRTGLVRTAGRAGRDRSGDEGGRDRRRSHARVHGVNATQENKGTALSAAQSFCAPESTFPAGETAV